MAVIVLYPYARVVQPFDNFFTLRKEVLNFTGVIAFTAMSITMLLSLRLRVVEKYLFGLDKAYRLHKWLGISAFILAITHWAWFQIPRWAVSLGYLVKPVKNKTANQFGSLYEILHAQSKLAEFLGEWSFYIIIVILSVALIKFFSYTLFRYLHCIIPLLYLAFAFHALILFKFEYWSTPLGLLLLILIICGSITAIISLSGRIGINKTHLGKITALEKLSISHSLMVTITIPSWVGHSAGQFAFLKLSADEAPHPFTIASTNAAQHQLTFMIKELGDYTRTLAMRLAIGDKVAIQGPYGDFNLKLGGNNNIWIAAGVGITPFMARLNNLIDNPSANKVQIDLFYCITKAEPELINNLTRLAQQAQVDLHIIGASDKRLTGAQIRDLFPKFNTAEIWFCGPKQFSQSIYKDLTANGLPAKSFHQEFFEFR